MAAYLFNRADMKRKVTEFVSNSVAETIELGKKIGSRFTGGEVVCLDGELGSGKTHLVKGIAAGLGVEDSDCLVSPTFVLVREYPCKFDVYHIDAYRLNSPAEFEALGFRDFIGPGAVILIEWANKVSKALEQIDCISIELLHYGSERRLIKIFTSLNIS